MKTIEAATRISLKNILFTTDFSPVSETALGYAKALARHYRAEIFATHIVEPSATALMPPESWGACQQAIEESAGHRMERLGELLDGIPHHTLIRHGAVWEMVLETVQENHIDLLVMGTHGRSGVGRFLMGSVAEEVFRRVSCPVLTVGPNVRANSAAGFHTILYATDFSHDSLAAVPYVLALAQDYQAQLLLMHVVTQEMGPLTDRDFIVVNCVRDLTALVCESGDLCREPEYIVNFGEPAESILQVARERDASLIVLGARPAQRSIGAATHVAAATAHAVVSQASCPVLTVRG